MATAIRAIGHEDRLSLVEHLDELRTRLIVCAIALAVALALCFWQNNVLLDLVNDPLKQSTETAAKKTGGPIGEGARFNLKLADALRQSSSAFQQLSSSTSRLNPAERRALAAAAAANQAALQAAPKQVTGRQPVTLGISEPLTATFTVAAYFALLLTMPLILYQAYAFVLPAFSPRERRVALPLMAMVPFLFLAGVAFGYFLVLPAAIKFLQNFNSGEFDILVQAKIYYKFVVLTLTVLGVLFQMPVGIVAVTRLGIVSPQQLRANRRYAIVIIAVIAVLLPGTDPITTMILMGPLVALYELSILLAAWVLRLERRRDEREALALDDADSDRPSSDDPTDET